MKFIDLTGKTFGRLKVIERVENSKDGQASWLCRCSCGNEVIVSAANLKSGNVQSCGCLSREIRTKHGMCGTSIYHTWQQMLSRCENPNAHNYGRYGGRGVKVCPQWHDFLNFYNDVSALPHFGEKGYNLDRIDNDGDYCLENVRFADINTQNRNKRGNIFVEYQGEKLCLKDAAEKSGINYATLLYRYYVGDRGEDLFAPIKKSNRQ